MFLGGSFASDFSIVILHWTVGETVDIVFRVAAFSLLRAVFESREDASTKID